ncbi:thymidine kinase [Marinomonas mediterranea]|jgi:thymidine kinase (EC 2.7.1.21)|uniref:Thymidine kinase n=1 Tax=Marinomonas mediterranea (strain ATCC 700492 / JCM 21426 / NBRC 103028 / MMB-1) TaxID=717774 RepID=F2K1K4_MARM1|nr:thymidine kinase [Marinomonas mediterranea]ADZ92234.1 Thymidine kinase [Marinomonas mediterranea MMB-1]WCN10191.1 thymidine kinase [Marinomonas mediterranea]WCN18292.1 thymidine kinase [Marinomonas mediterranea MMB-1]
MAKLYYYYSAMNAGKSTVLLQSAHNYRERGMRVKLFTAAIDDRYKSGTITSRIGISAEATSFNSSTDMLELIRKEHEQSMLGCILIDESQFLTKSQVEQLCDVVDILNIPVLAFGIRTDFQGELFEGSQALLAWADKLIELKTVCHCGNKATMVVRLDTNGIPVKEGVQVEIGGNDRYVSVCRKHFREAVKG